MTPDEVDLCGQCGQPGTETIADCHDWVLWVCHACALRYCDPLHPTPGAGRESNP